MPSARFQAVSDEPTSSSSTEQLIRVSRWGYPRRLPEDACVRVRGLEIGAPPIPRQGRNGRGRGLMLFGLFGAIAGAGGTLSVHTGSGLPDGDAKVEAAAAPTSAGPFAASTAVGHESAPRLRAPAPALGANGAPAGAVTRASDAGAQLRPEDPAIAQEREARVTKARRELEFLENQDPTHFLAIFEVMKTNDRWDSRKLEAASNESHAYILARTRLLEGMLRRFIDDPDSDHTVEMDALAHLDADFKQKLDGFARDIPPVANLQELLTTTTLKAPGFTEPPAEPE